MAAQVYQISKAGNLSRHEVRAEDTLYNTIEDDDQVDTVTDSVDERPTKTAKSDSLQTSQAASRITDRTVYRTYFGAIGPGNLFIFVFFGIAFAFCLKFPGEYLECYSRRLEPKEISKS
jgi:hypothetical protein